MFSGNEGQFWILEKERTIYEQNVCKGQAEQMIEFLRQSLGDSPR
jgi:hypothetical protein